MEVQEVILMIIGLLISIVEVVLRIYPTSKNWSMIDNILRLLEDVLTKYFPNKYVNPKNGFEGVFKTSEHLEMTKGVLPPSVRKRALKQVKKARDLPVSNEVYGIVGKMLK